MRVLLLRLPQLPMCREEEEEEEGGREGGREGGMRPSLRRACSTSSGVASQNQRKGMTSARRSSSSTARSNSFFAWLTTEGKGGKEE